MNKKKIDREGIVLKANIDGKTVYQILVPNYRENKPYENILYDAALTPEEATEKLTEWQEKRKEKERQRDERRAAKIKEAKEKKKELSAKTDNTQKQLDLIYTELVYIEGIMRNTYNTVRNSAFAIIALLAIFFISFIWIR